MLNECQVLGFTISTLSVSEIVKGALSGSGVKVLNTLNPHSYVEQKKDGKFRQALLSSDILIADGVGIVYAAKILNDVRISKIAGYDLFQESMKQINSRAGRVFFLGSSTQVLYKIEKRVQSDFKNIEVKTLSPLFKNDFDEDDIESFSFAINDFRPDVVFVGLTAPKQEKLISDLRDRVVGPKYLAGVGAVFDFYAETVNRPSDLWIKLHLEWLARFISEPKRLWRRVFLSTPIFIADLLLLKFKG